MLPRHELVYHFLIWKGLKEPERTAYFDYWKDRIPGFREKVLRYPHSDSH